MKYSKTNYPIGAIWECTQGSKIGYIKLFDRRSTFEVWHFGWYYGDGSGHQFDWTTSYQSARRNHWMGGRFKRVDNSL